MQLDFWPSYWEEYQLIWKDICQKHQQLLADLDHLMDGLDSLSSGLLSHSIIPPGKLAELFKHVNMELIEHFKEYELAMTEMHQYNDLPFVSYSYTDDMLICKFQFI